jgi:hypothetical protein
LGNARSVKSYIEYFQEQIRQHKLVEKTLALLEKATNDPNHFLASEAAELNAIDQQLTSIMLAGERKCSKKACQ